MQETDLCQVPIGADIHPRQKIMDFLAVLYRVLNVTWIALFLVVFGLPHLAQRGYSGLFYTAKGKPLANFIEAHTMCVLAVTYAPYCFAGLALVCLAVLMSNVTSNTGKIPPHQIVSRMTNYAFLAVFAQLMFKYMMQKMY